MPCSIVNNHTSAPPNAKSESTSNTAKSSPSMLHTAEQVLANSPKSPKRTSETFMFNLGVGSALKEHLNLALPGHGRIVHQLQRASSVASLRRTRMIADIGILYLITLCEFPIIFLNWLSTEWQWSLTYSSSFCGSTTTGDYHEGFAKMHKGCKNIKTVGKVCETTVWQNKGDAGDVALFVAMDCRSNVPLPWCKQDEIYLRKGVAKVSKLYDY